MTTKISDAMFPETDELEVVTQLDHLLSVKGRMSGNYTHVVLDLEGVEALARELITFIRNHPDAQRSAPRREPPEPHLMFKTGSFTESL